jgi:hypothetical protein
MYQNNKEAYCLANTYGFMPPMPVYPARIRNTNSGKFEPDHNIGAESRCMLLAHYAGASNVMIKYKPAELIF